MNEEAKTKWLQLLNSGEIKQTQFRLGAGHGEIPSEMCCLGAACEAYRLVTGKGRWERVRDEGFVDSPSFMFIDENDNGCMNYMPPAVSEWLGLSKDYDPRNPSAVYTSEDGHSHGFLTLTHLNDSLLLTFGEISKLIKEKP